MNNQFKLKLQKSIYIFLSFFFLSLTIRSMLGYSLALIISTTCKDEIRNTLEFDFKK